MQRFDSKALYNALDQKRREHQMSWSQVSAEIGVSVSTITRTQRGSRLEVDGYVGYGCLAWCAGRDLCTRLAQLERASHFGRP